VQGRRSRCLRKTCRNQRVAANFPHDIQKIEPVEKTCPDCGDELELLGEDVSEMLELEPVRFNVIR
jgi:transposase